MKITPLDVVHHEFGKKMLGVDPQEVASLLKDICAEWEQALRTVSDQRSQIEQLEKLLELYRDKEGTLKQTLFSAQKVTDEMKANAQKEAHMLLAQAQMKANQTLRQAHERLKEVVDQIQRMRRQKIEFQANFKSLVETHLKLISMNEAHDVQKNFEDLRILPKTN